MTEKQTNKIKNKKVEKLVKSAISESIDLDIENSEIIYVISALVINDKDKQAGSLLISNAVNVETVAKIVKVSVGQLEEENIEPNNKPGLTSVIGNC